MLRFAILGSGYGRTVYLPALERCGFHVSVLAARQAHSDVHVTQTDDWRAAVSRPDVDCVVVALPPKLQRQATEYAAFHGKAVICEKPAGLTVEDTSAMLGHCQAAGVANAVGFQFRYEHGFERLKYELDNGSIGTLERIDVDWIIGGPASRSRPWSWRNDVDEGGGVVLNFATHCIDYVRWLTGAQIKTCNLYSQRLVPFRSLGPSFKEVTAPDSCDLLLDFEQGPVFASIRISNVATIPVGHRVVLRGSRGTISVNHVPPFRSNNFELEISSPTHNVVLGGPDLGMADFDGDSRLAPVTRLVSQFASSLKGQVERHLPTLADALEVQRLLADSINSNADFR